MSKLTYLASSRRLPTGEFVSRPDKIYRNYAQYRSSTDYVVPWMINLTAAYVFAPEIYQADCPVWVYREEKACLYFPLEDYNPDHARTIHGAKPGEDGTDADVIRRSLQRQEVSSQFTAPYLYHIGMFCDGYALTRFLCEHLQPGDIAEKYTCWALDESQPRDRSRDIVIDLQAFVDTLDPMFDQDAYAQCGPDKLFVTYLAPQSGTLKNDWVDCDTVIEVYLDTRVECIPDWVSKRYGRDPDSV